MQRRHRRGGEHERFWLDWFGRTECCKPQINTQTESTGLLGVKNDTLLDSLHTPKLTTHLLSVPPPHLSTGWKWLCGAIWGASSLVPSVHQHPRCALGGVGIRQPNMSSLKVQLWIFLTKQNRPCRWEKCRYQSLKLKALDKAPNVGMTPRRETPRMPH